MNVEVPRTYLFALQMQNRLITLVGPINPFGMALELDGIRCPVIGSGGSGVVVLRGTTAVKLPKSYMGGCYDDDDDDEEAEVIQWEKEVYRRLVNCDGVVPCLGLSGPGIDMVWMENGNLRDYLDQHRVSTSVQLSWFRDMAQTLASIHDRRVIVADIRARNFLLAKDLSTIKFSDFTESSLLELDCDMQNVDDNGYSIYTDIGQLGAVMYEVITGEKCVFDLFKGQPPGPATAAWPRRDYLPNTEESWLGSIIEKCWTKGAFRSCRELSVALDSATI
jgi:hypothetical protein